MISSVWHPNLSFTHDSAKTTDKKKNQMIKMMEFDKHEMSIAPGFPLRKIQILNHTKI